MSESKAKLIAENDRCGAVVRAAALVVDVVDNADPRDTWGYAEVLRLVEVLRSALKGAFNH